MVRSMTGFGRGEAGSGARRYTVDVRAINHRFAEVVVRLPRLWPALEDRVRRRAGERISRGRLEVFLAVTGKELAARAVRVDRELARAYGTALAELAEVAGVPRPEGIELLARMPDVLRVEEREADLEEVWADVGPALDAALAGMTAMREAEGAALWADLEHRFSRLEALLGEVEAQSPTVVEGYRRRLAERIRGLAPEAAVDPGRLAVEVALFADRADVAEEVARFRSHLAQARALGGEGGAVGRRFDFLVQEMLREANSIGSKAPDAAISRAAVDLKGELEKVREQVQNLE